MNREQPTGGLLRTRWDRGLLLMIGFSLGLHVLVVAVIVAIRPWSRERSVPPPPAYTVELTSLTSLGSNVVPGAPGDRLTGGRAEPPRMVRPPAPAVAPKAEPEIAKVPAPPAERVPVQPPPPAAPPKVEPPPVVANEPVRLPEPPKTPPRPPEVSAPPSEAPKPEAPKPIAKAPAPPPADKPSPERAEVPAAAVEAKPDKDVPKKPDEPPAKPPDLAAKPEKPAQEATPADPPKPAEKPQPTEAQKAPADDAKKPVPPAVSPEKSTVASPAAAPSDARDAEPSPSATQDGAAPGQDTQYAAAIDRVRRRVETGAGGLMGDGDARQAPSIGGAGPGGGNQVVGAEFLIYYNIMLSHIKRTWLWVGHDDTLSVTVHFRIGPEGEIGDVRLERPSADATYDESVLRAVREASPLPPPPAAHQRDFGDVRLTFRPGDLREPG